MSILRLNSLRLNNFFEEERFTEVWIDREGVIDLLQRFVAALHGEEDHSQVSTRLDATRIELQYFVRHLKCPFEILFLQINMSQAFARFYIVGISRYFFFEGLLFLRINFSDCRYFHFFIAGCHGAEERYDHAADERADEKGQRDF